jgi:hypothetical protein
LLLRPGTRIAIAPVAVPATAGKVLHLADFVGHRLQVRLVHRLVFGSLHRLLLAVAQLVELSQRLAARSRPAPAVPFRILAQHCDERDLVDHLVACPCSFHIRS